MLLMQPAARSAISGGSVRLLKEAGNALKHTFLSLRTTDSRGRISEVVAVGHDRQAGGIAIEQVDPGVEGGAVVRGDRGGLPDVLAGPGWIAGTPFVGVEGGQERRGVLRQAKQVAGDGPRRVVAEKQSRVGAYIDQECAAQGGG